MKSSIRFALVLAGVLAAPNFGRAQAAPPPIASAPAVASTNGSGPKIQFNTEIYDAGTNVAGDKIRYTFIVTNTGNETLVLSNVKPSCGCTTVGGTLPGETTSGSGAPLPSTTTWTHEIAPGQIGIIPIQIATDNLRGAIHKSVAVTSNDRMRPNVTLQISGTVWVPVEISPPSAYFSLMPDTTATNTQVVKIFNRTEAPLILSDPVSTTNAFAVVLKTNDPGKEYELLISAVPSPHLLPSLSTTILQGQISLKSSDTNKNPLIIPVLETIYPEITVLPPNIPLPAGPLAQANTTHITIRDNIADMRLSDPVVNAPGVHVSLVVIQTNRQYNIFVVFPKGFEIPTGQNIVLSVKTDNSHFPTLNIPVTPVPGPAQPVRASAAPPPMRTSLLPPAHRTFVPAPSVSSNTPVPAMPRVNAP